MILRMVEGFILRQVQGEYVAVPSGKAAQVFSGLIALNETGADIFRLLQQGMSRGELLEQMQALYDVPSEELTADVEELLGQFRQLGIVNEVAE